MFSSNFLEILACVAVLTSSKVFSCANGADMLLDMLEKCQLVPVRIPSLFQQNVFKAVGRTEIEGICKVYGRETNWKLYPLSLASKKWGAIEALLQMTPIRAALTCSKACDVIAEDAFSVASQHSIGLIDIKWGTLMRPQIRYATWIPLAIPTLTWGSRDPKSYQFYTDQSCSKMVGHISQEYELTKTQTNKKGVFHSVSILERTTVRQKCSLVGLELEVATSC